MTMTARMVVLMDPEEKRAIERRAKSYHLTPSEWVRQAAREYDPTPDEEVLTLLAEQMEEAAVHMKKRLNDALAYSDARMAEMHALRAEHNARLDEYRRQRGIV